MVRRLKPNKRVVLYHVMTRTAQLKYWLEDEPQVKNYWIQLLNFYSKVFYIDVLGFTILSNHFHLCLRVNRPDFDSADVRARHAFAQSRVKNPRTLQPELEDRYYRNLIDLSKFMALINQRTALFYNKLKGTKGHFWGAPFNSKVIDSERYLLNVMAYIDLNSVRAGLVSRPESYPFSSIARFKSMLERQKLDISPRIGCLKKLPDFKRARTYIALVNYLNIQTKAGVPHKTASRRFIEGLVGEEGIQEMLLTINQRIATDWRQEPFSLTMARRCQPSAPS